MLGTLSISMWTGRKNAPKEAKKIEEDNNARAGAISAALHLMVGVPEHEAIVKNTAMNRKWWTDQTVPWFGGRGGPRATLAASVIDLTAKNGERKNDWQSLVDAFCDWYERGYSARVFDLGKFYDPKLFPLPVDMRKRFRWSLAWDVLPPAADIRILDGIDPAELKRMEQAAIEQERERIARATSDIAQRLYKCVESMHKTMSIKHGDPGGKFHASKLENITALADLIPSLNFMQDPKLDEMAKLARKLALKSPEELKGDEVKRATAAKEAGALASKLAAMFVDGDEDDE
jgi:hypothetical protein